MTFLQAVLELSIISNTIELLESRMNSVFEELNISWSVISDSLLSRVQHGRDKLDERSKRCCSLKKKTFKHLSPRATRANSQSELLQLLTPLSKRSSPSSNRQSLPPTPISSVLSSFSACSSPTSPPPSSTRPPVLTSTSARPCEMAFQHFFVQVPVIMARRQTICLQIASLCCSLWLIGDFSATRDQIYKCTQGVRAPARLHRSQRLAVILLLGGSFEHQATQPSVGLE